MTSREIEIMAARDKISDEHLIDFLRKINIENNHPEILAVTSINDSLDDGESLDQIFYNGEEYGFTLSIVQTDDEIYEINFGCVAGYYAGDGGEWNVVLDKHGQILSVENKHIWRC